MMNQATMIREQAFQIRITASLYREILQQPVVPGYAAVAHPTQEDSANSVDSQNQISNLSLCVCPHYMRSTLYKNI